MCSIKQIAMEAVAEVAEEIRPLGVDASTARVLEVPLGLGQQIFVGLEVVLWATNGSRLYFNVLEQDLIREMFHHQVGFDEFPKFVKEQIKQEAMKAAMTYSAKESTRDHFVVAGATVAAPIDAVLDKYDNALKDEANFANLSKGLEVQNGN